MRRQKALLPWQGMTLIDYQLTQLSTIDDVRQIIVVTGHEPERIREHATAYERVACVHNADYGSGKVSSIKAGLSAVRSDADAVVLLAVDQPRSADVIQRLLRAHFDSGGPITVPVHAGSRGHPVVFAASLLPELRGIAEETQGIRALLADARRVREVEFEGAGVLRDLNTPEDLTE